MREELCCSGCSRKSTTGFALEVVLLACLETGDPVFLCVSDCVAAAVVDDVDDVAVAVCFCVCSGSCRGLDQQQARAGGRADGPLETQKQSGSGHFCRN